MPINKKTISSKKLLKEIESLSSIESKDQLGQVFTPDWIAELMVYFGIKHGKERCIDPCFGEGVFINKIKNFKSKKFEGIITAVELDTKLYNNFVEIDANIDLLLGSFFDYNEGFDSYDFAIMNPPYIRQEELANTTTPNEINKKSLINKISQFVSNEYINKKANLYYYFLIYITQFLKDGGVLSAITYNSWLFTEFGQTVQKFILDNYKINYIIDFDKDSFSNAIIGSCIMILEKKSDVESRNNNIVSFLKLKSTIDIQQIDNLIKNQTIVKNSYKIKQQELYNENKWEKFLNLPDFHIDLMKENEFYPLSHFVDIKRGYGPVSAKYFIVNREIIDEFDIPNKYLTPILKSLKHLNSEVDSYHYLLNIAKEINENDEVFKYLDYIKEDVLIDNKGSSTLRSKILSQKDWYLSKFKKSPPEILFSYIIRLNKNFYYNKNFLLTDNFYMLNTKLNFSVNIILAILNSTITKYFLELYGRTQGNGLLKIQVYELKELPIININKLDDQVLLKLEKLGQELSFVLIKGLRPDLIIKKIDQIIFPIINKGKFTNQIIDSLKKIEYERISKKNG